MRWPPATFLLPPIAAVMALVARGPKHNRAAAAAMGVGFAGGVWVASREPLAVDVDDAGLRVRRLFGHDRWAWSRVRGCRIAVHTGRGPSWPDAEIVTDRRVLGLVPPGAPLLPLVGAVRRRIAASARGSR